MYFNNGFSFFYEIVSINHMFRMIEYRIVNIELNGWRILNQHILIQNIIKHFLVFYVIGNGTKVLLIQSFQLLTFVFQPTILTVEHIHGHRGCRQWDDLSPIKSSNCIREAPTVKSTDFWALRSLLGFDWKIPLSVATYGRTAK